MPQELATSTAVGRAAGATGEWLVWPRRNPRAAVRLVMIPGAGVGPSAFRSWTRLLLPDVEQAIVQLPGRDRRWFEAPLAAVADVVDALGVVLERELDRRFALFGHSLGALIAFELARRLRGRFGLEPRALIVAAMRAPHLPNVRPRIARLPDDEFLDAVDERHEAIPPEMRENRELLDLVLRTLRTDYAMFEDYDYVPGAPFRCPVEVFGGRADPVVSSGDLDAWREHTTGEFAVGTLAGGHFFLNDHADAIAARVVELLRRWP